MNAPAEVWIGDAHVYGELKETGMWTAAPSSGEEVRYVREDRVEPLLRVLRGVIGIAPRHFTRDGIDAILRNYEKGEDGALPGVACPVCHGFPPARYDCEFCGGTGVTL